MDVDMIRAEDHMEMMTMMMQMEKLPEFCDLDFQTNSTLAAHEIQFSNVNTLPFYNNPNISSNSSSSSNSLMGNQIHQEPMSSNPLPLQQPNKFKYAMGPLISSNANSVLEKRNSNMAAMREMIFRIAAMQPIHIDPESVKPPKRRNVKISKDPQSVAARHRRERISERIRILQRLVPGGTKMDTASMLDEAIHYVKFLKKQVQSLERVAAANNNWPNILGTNGTLGLIPAGSTMGGNVGYSSLVKGCQQPSSHQMVGNLQMLR